MVKKFVDEFNNTYVFIQAGDYLVCVLNGKAEYTVTSIATLPDSLDEARKIYSLDIWYPINEIAE